MVWLIAAGHDPDGAEGWATQVTAWSDGPQRAIDLFAVAQAHQWETAADTRPDVFVRRMADAAAAWVAHRRPRPI